MTRRTDKLVARLLAELEKHGIVMNACSKVGIGSSTYYRWRDEDGDFRRKAEAAITIGRRNITDLAESKLVQNIRNGNQRAIEFHLRGNDIRYMVQSRKELEEQIQKIRKENDTSSAMRALQAALTGAITMQDSEQLMAKYRRMKASGAPLKPPSNGEYYQYHTEESYIGKLIATGIFDELIKTYGDEIKRIQGVTKMRPYWGLRDMDKMTAGGVQYVEYDDSGSVIKRYSFEEYKEKRRQEIREYNIARGIPENEGTDF